MKPDERMPPMTRSGRVYRCLLMAYPKSFRERDAEGMQYTFAMQLNEARDLGKLSLTLFWCRTALHVLVFGLAERLSQARRRPVDPYWRHGTGEARWGVARIGKLRQEIHQTSRRLARRPSLTATVMLSLALGIGTSTAVFSLLFAVLIEPLPYPESNRLVGVWHTDPATPKWGHSQIAYLFYREQNRVFEDIGVYRERMTSVTGGETPEELRATIVSASTLDLLGVSPLFGRGFREDEEHPDAERTVILSHRIWASRYGADRTVLGKTVQIDGEGHTVIGVMPAAFQFPNYETQLWLPMQIDRMRPDRSYWDCNAIARLAAGIDVSRALAEMQALVGRLSEAYPDPESVAATLEEIGLSAVVHPFKDDVVGDVSVALWILFVGVGCVLLIAFANSANLLLVSAEERLQEIALRTALGASRAALLFTFLIESTILALGGGLLGLGVAAITMPTILALTPQHFPRLETVGIGGPVLLFALGVSLFGGLILGLMPGLHRTQSPASALQAGGYRVTGALKHKYVRDGLAVTQLALALVLMTGSGLMLRSFQNIRSVEPGFQSEGVLTFRLRAPADANESNEETAALYKDVLDRLRAVPGVQSVGAADGLPLAGGGSMLGHSFEDFPPAQNAHLPNYLTLQTVPGFLEALQIPLVAGRLLEPSDLDGETKAVLVSAPLAVRLWPNESAVGKRLTPARFEDTGVWYEIVGVVGAVRYERIETTATEAIYYPRRPLYFSSNSAPLYSQSLNFAVRTGLDASALVEPVTAAVWSIAPNLPVTQIRSMTEIVAQASARTTFSLTLLGVAACVALALGLLGLYGVISFLVSQRTREIGIRMALGADCGRVNRMVLGQALRLAGLGMLLGLTATVALSRFFKSMLYELSPTDPLTVTVVSLLLLITALAASYLPARRAARVDPLQAVAEF